jgi:hypothetical protein
MFDDKDRRRKRLGYKKKDRSREKKRDRKFGDFFQSVDELMYESLPSQPEWDLDEEQPA